MFGLRASPQQAEDGAPVQSRRQKTLRLCLAILIAPIVVLAGSGCAQKQSPEVAMMKPHHLTSEEAAQPVRSYAEVDLEDDGREAQQPPLVMRKPDADDPNEPYSPNYGRVSASEDEYTSQTSDHSVFQTVTPNHARGSVSFQQSMLR